MNLNSLLSFNGYSKGNYIRCVFRCILSIFLCSILSFSIVQASEGGGGSSRGGGAGRINSVSPMDVNLQQGFVSTLAGGELIINDTTASYYSTFIRIDSNNYTMTAKSKKIYSVYTIFRSNTSTYNPYWINFYNYNGSTYTFLGSTPQYKSSVDTEVPGNTTFITISSTNMSSGQVVFSGEGTGESDYVYSYNEHDNLWTLGLGASHSIDGGNYNFNGQIEYNIPSLTVPITSGSVGTNYFFPSRKGDSYNVLNNSTRTVKVYFIFYDATYKIIGNSVQTMTTGTSVTANQTNTSARYMKIFLGTNDAGRLSADQWKEQIVFTGLDETEITSTAYQLDTSSANTLVNNYYYSGNTYQITSGDNSTITVIDGNNNTVTLPGSSPIVTEPGSPVPIPGEETEEDEEGDGLFDSILDVLKSLFEGLGDILAGILEILLIPVNFIIDALADTLELLKGVIQSLGGLSEFFSQVFFFLPSPIPEMLTLFIPAVLVVAIVKMFL